MLRRPAAALLSAAVLLLAACGTGSGGADAGPSVPGAGQSSSSVATAPSTPAQSPGAPATSSGSASSSGSAASSEPAAPLVGKTVVIDPGHNGANAAHPEIVNQPVPDGAGGTKPCNTTGTSTAEGYPEHEMNWQIAVAVRDQLAAQGAAVVLTRPDDGGVGPCVDERAAIANDSAADAFVSIHGDGAATSSRGFYCIVTPLAPGGADVAAESLLLAETVRDGIAKTAVMPTATYQGSNGVDAARADLAGLNLSTRPSTLCELGNMRNPQDAAVQTSADGRAALAAGIANGLIAYLSG